jgi:hypothetical protein
MLAGLLAALGHGRGSGALPQFAAAPRVVRRGGQGIVEYSLILSLMVVVAGVILVVFGGALADVLSVIGSAIDSAT